jgi:peptidyl-prolyl cis-trans isomerase SurA
MAGVKHDPGYSALAGRCASPRINSAVPAGTKTVGTGRLERTSVGFCSAAERASPERDGPKVAQDDSPGYFARTWKESRKGRLKILLIAFSLLGTMVPLRAWGQENAGAPSAPNQTAPPTPPIPQGAVVLDHVVAVINGSVILQSDVMEEMGYAFLQPFNITGARNTPQRALQRLIDRDLILQQMETAQTVTPPPAEDVQQRIAQLRGVIPECSPDHCQTAAGWQAFLRTKGLTEKDVEAHWAQRMLILSFIQSRFGAGVHITPAEIADYYNKTLVPQLQAKAVKPPALPAVSPRIEEILLQQRVSSLLLEWLQSLKSEGSVSILDPVYGKVGATGSGDDSEAGGQP